MKFEQKYKYSVCYIHMTESNISIRSASGGFIYWCNQFVLVHSAPLLFFILWNVDSNYRKIRIIIFPNAMLFVDKHFVDKHFVDRSSSTEFRRIFFRRQGSLSTGVLSTAGSSTDELVDIALGR